MDFNPPPAGTSQPPEPAQGMLPLDPPAVVEAPKADWREQVPSVSQLTRRLRGHIENSFFDVWVRGEISNFRKPVSGHAYFVLKDATAQLKAVMFRGSLAKLKFSLKDGMEILLHGTVSVYEARGEYQLVADAVEPVGAGALQQAFEELKAKLHKEGLFAPERKKKLPFLPKRIGIVTSATGAAVKDILKVFSRRFPDRHVLIFPAAVQGEKAAGEIARAIEMAQRWSAERPAEKIDVLIVGRGGGSLEDLWPFNEEVVARAIAACTIPTVSAVGHEIDYTIADFVADLRAPTPSAAAEIVLPRKEDLAGMVHNSASKMRLLFSRRISQSRLHLGHLAQRLVDPRQKIKLLRENFSRVLEKLTMTEKSLLLAARRRLEERAGLLHSFSPLQTLARGFSLTLTEDGTIVRSVTQVENHQILVTRLAEGEVRSSVLK